MQKADFMTPSHGIRNTFFRRTSEREICPKNPDLKPLAQNEKITPVFTVGGDLRFDRRTSFIQ
ncbi:hypothetical protein N24_2677 [Corynebacterium suranareeae]|uniref:Uncharacterized protein n=1 Tax=Corynebacterium suranareeae TaxID=2506452 RepID=A0A160PS24_9CORY|nr:hypothetical protein N24_2677 [Corynebacterium suranareeae]